MSTYNTSAAVVATVAVSTTSAQLIAAGTGRRAVIIYNGSGQAIYLRFGTTAASTTDYSLQVPNAGYYELPQPIFGGAIQVITGAGAGNVQVTSW